MSSGARNLKIYFRKQRTSFFLVILLSAVGVFAYYGDAPREVSALTTEETTQEITTGIGAQNATLLYREASPQTVSDLANRVSVKKVVRATQSAGAGNFGQALRRLGVGSLSGILQETTGVNVGGLIKKTGVDTLVRVFSSGRGLSQNQLGRAGGKLLGQVGVRGVSNTISKTGGQIFGDFLGQSGCVSIVGGGCSGTQLNTKGLESVGQTILRSGSVNVGRLINVLGGKRAGTFVTRAGGISASQAINILGADGIQSATANLGDIDLVADILNEEGIDSLTSFVDEDLMRGLVGGGGSNPCSYGGNISIGSLIDDIPTEELLGGGGISDGGGAYVPVKDFLTESNTTLIQQNTNSIKNDTEKMRSYLQALCMKEYEHDPQIKKAWAGTIDRFVKRTISWITNAYQQNPVFVTNPHIFYRNIEYGINLAMIADIEKSNIDESIKETMVKTLTLLRQDKVFPDLASENWTGVNKTIWDDPNDFTWEAWEEGTGNPNNNIYDIQATVMREYEGRKAAAIEIEKQKLDWGRGYYPWEVCGAPVFSGDYRDQRTCETLTPGSTLQDLTTLVLSTTLRQMENADEYEEWISQDALRIVNDVLSDYGLRDAAAGTRGANGAPINPDEASVIIEAGAERRVPRLDIDPIKSLNFFNETPFVPAPF